MSKSRFLKNVEKIKQKVTFSVREVRNSGRRGVFSSQVFILALRVFLAVIRLTINRQCEVGYQLPWKADGGIPGLDERHQDVDIIRAYGLLLVISANGITSCDNRNFPRYRSIAGISIRGKFLSVIR